MAMRSLDPEIATGDEFDVVVIGGGASGLAAARAAARAGADACVLERDVEVGLSILATGNGRCNLSNARLDPARYRHPEAARAVMGDEPEAELERFFGSLGIMTASEDGRLYPRSKRAESVRDALRFAPESGVVTIQTSADVTGAEFDSASDTWSLAVCVPRRNLTAHLRKPAKSRLRALRREAESAPRKTVAIRARRVVVACGGASSSMADMLGIEHVPERPVLCPVACTIELPHRDGEKDRREAAEDSDVLLDLLDGTRVEGELGLFRDDERIWSERGEVLFRTYGLSGIAAFDLSRRAEPGDAICLDLFCDYGPDELERIFGERERAIGSLSCEGLRWFHGMLAPAVARLVLAAAGGVCDPHVIAQAAKRVPFRFIGTTEERSAQVRRGGIPFSAVELPSLSVRAHAASGRSGLFACGEALDMDADCGGFNLAWAWLSGIRAGTAAAADVR